MTNVPYGWLPTLEAEQIPYEDAATEEQAIRLARERIGVRLRDSGISIVVDWDDPPDAFLEEADANLPKHWLVAFSAYVAPTRVEQLPSVNFVPAFLVDRLPLRLWRPANLYVGGHLHFCIGANDLGDTVRTVEWEGREVGHGRRALDPVDIPEH